MQYSIFHRFAKVLFAERRKPDNLSNFRSYVAARWTFAISSFLFLDEDLVSRLEGRAAILAGPCEDSPLARWWMCRVLGYPPLRDRRHWSFFSLSETNELTNWKNIYACQEENNGWDEVFRVTGFFHDFVIFKWCFGATHFQPRIPLLDVSREIDVSSMEKRLPAIGYQVPV